MLLGWWCKSSKDILEKSIKALEKHLAFSLFNWFQGFIDNHRQIYCINFCCVKTSAKTVYYDI